MRNGLENGFVGMPYGGMINGLAPIGGSIKKYLPETVAWLNRLTYWPSLYFISAIDDALRELMTSGDLFHIERFWIFFQEIQANSLVSIINPSGINAIWPTNISLSSTPTFSPLLGWTGNGTQAVFLNTNYNPTTNGVRLSQNSASIGYWKTTNGFGVKATTVDMGAISFPTGGGNIYLGIQDNVEAGFTNIIYITETTTAHGCGYTGASKGPGMYIGLRKVSTGEIMYYNGQVVATSSSGSTGVPNANVIIMNDTGNQAPSPRTYTMAFVGDGLVNPVTFYNTILKLKNRVGARF